MKQSIKSLFALMLMLGAMLEMKAADVYLLTAQTINGTGGKYEVPSNHKLAPSTSYGSNVYSLKITSMPEGGFWFRIGVSGRSNQIQPKVNDAPLTINEEGTQNPTSDSGCDGSSNAWKVSYTADEYEYLTVNVDITEGSTHRVWIEGKKKTSAGGSDEPVAQSTDVEPGYYLVGNFFSEHNVGGKVNPGGDGATIDYTKHVYFKFEQQKDNSYAFSIPACLTAHAQILAVDDYGNKMVYGPGEVFKLHGAKNYTSASPLKNGAVGTICGTTAAKTLVGSETLAEGDNYWDLVTRNDNVTDDDGMYTFSFTLDKDGNPSGWQVEHDAKTRVSYILGDMKGATAQPLYNKRASDKGDYDNNMYASLYFNGSNGYWGIGYIANDLSNENSDQFKQAQKATPDIHVTQSLEHDKSGTHNKLFFLGNGGYDYTSSYKYRDKVWPNQKPFSLNLHGIKRVEYNPTRGNNDLVVKDGSYGMSGSIYIDGANQADFSITTMSMIGDAVEGTYDAKTGNWNYTSKAGDMEYDANERCFSLTISTEEEKYNTPHYFRFVANHDAAQNWGETDNNVTNNTGLARSRYDGADDAHHTCMPGDPNDVQHRTTARENETDSDIRSRRDILWNRPAGNWRIKFYPEIDKDKKDASYYTISGTKVIKIPFTYRVGKFIRTYSNSVAMAPVNDNVKVYEAYKYGAPVNAKNPQSQGTIYLRQLKYIPANMGVVLVGEVPEEGTFLDGAKLNFSLREAPAEMPLEGDNYTAVWTKADEYVGQEWNNYLVPTVSAIDNLGNADTDDKGTILHRFFGLGNFHSTNYYKQNGTGDDYIGFFRLTQNGRSGANKAYLSIPANKTVDSGVGATYGYIDFNGQFLGNETDLNNQSLAKMAIVFDDEDNGGTTNAVREVKMDTADADAPFYTLQGIKVSRPVKGVYIHNGKKFIK